MDRAGVSEKTMFVHMGEGGVRGLSTWRGQKCFMATNFVHMNSNALLVSLF